MSKFKEYIESIRKDKKKGLVAFALVVVFLVTIIAGILSAGGTNEAEGEKSNQISSLDIPVDTNSINKGRTYGSGGSTEGDFFSSVRDSINEANNGESQNKSNSSQYTAYSHTYKQNTGKGNYGSSGTNVKSNNTGVSNTQVNTYNDTESSAAEKRRRAPDDGAGNMSRSSKLYSAVVANGDKAVKSGSYVKIRVAEDISVDGVKVPRNSVITGLAQYTNERMMINVTSVKSGTESKKVDWVIYDEDGNLGVAVPASVLNDIVRDGADEAIDKGSSVEANVPLAGSVKLNIQKKNKEVSFVIRDGHRVYIKAKKS